MGEYAKENLRRLMSARGLSHKDVVRCTGLDRRTIRGLLNGTNRPHAKTIHRLAKGLGVATDEFFVSPSYLIYRNLYDPADLKVEGVVRNNPALFSSWAQADFEELQDSYSLSDDQSAEGILDVARKMNRRRDLQKKLNVLLKSSQSDAISTFLEVMYKTVAG